MADFGSDDALVGKLREVAREALDTFDTIAKSARAGLGERGLSLDSLASINQSTAEDLAEEMRNCNQQRISDCLHLRREPAIARLVVADEHDQQEIFYLSPVGTVDAGKVRFCSYMSPKGRLAAFAPGNGTDIPLPGGRRWFDILEKTTFKPTDDDGEWDSRPAIHFRENERPLTIRSLRELLLEDGFDEEEVDEIEAWLASDGAAAAEDNISEGIKRDTLTAMQLRVAPILDEFQDKIFRLPIDSQIAVLGPPGTGKTTTLVRRLRQKIDFAYLDPEEEQPLVEAGDESGLPHAESWIMFSPTELLRLYVKEAFGKEGVPVHDARIRTWEDYRREVGRGSLRILRSGTGSGLVLRDDDSILGPDTLTDQIAWFGAFDAWQTKEFVRTLQDEAERLENGADARGAALGRQVREAIERSADKPIQLLGVLAGLRDRLSEIASGQREESRAALREPLKAYAKDDREFLEALSQFVAKLESGEPDAEDEEDLEVDEDEYAERTQPLRGRRLVEDVFVKAMRSRALAQASGRSPAAASRAGRVLAWLRDRGLTLPDLRELGAALLVQRAAARLSRAPNDYLGKLPLRYRRFRRAMREESTWYGDGKFAATDAHPAEVDVILLAMLRTAREMEADQLLGRRLEDRPPPLLAEIARIRRNQVLVDEATDFSPVQLACMRALANPQTNSFFAAGDFNQRLTRWGSRSREELQWVSPELDIEPIEVTYRQSSKLSEFARKLGQAHGYEVSDLLPEDIDNVGVDPVLGLSLDEVAKKAHWLAARIGEINNFTDGVLPTIAVLVSNPDGLEPLAIALSEELEPLNIKAVACPRGMVKGQDGDVRIFEVEHIKGLEFEAVFFMDVDELEQRQPELFERFIYVGATRAATFLGLTCRGPDLPLRLSDLRSSLAEHW